MEKSWGDFGSEKLWRSWGRVASPPDPLPLPGGAEGSRLRAALLLFQAWSAPPLPRLTRKGAKAYTQEAGCKLREEVWPVQRQKGVEGRGGRDSAPADHVVPKQLSSALY